MTVYESPCRRGQILGCIKQIRSESGISWKLVKAKVTDVRPMLQGVRITTEGDDIPICLGADVEFATEIMEAKDGPNKEWVILDTPFLFSYKTLPKARKWVTWANRNPQYTQFNI